MICPQCKSENIAERDITPFFLCLECGNSFNDSETPYIIDHYEKNKTINEIKDIIYNKDEMTNSLILIYLILFPFLLAIFI